jgi:simple sugar transport system ATP-binding protein
LSRHGEYEDISFRLRRGEVLGLTGLLGAGRTEVALTLFGLKRPDAGQILLDGKPVSLRSNADAIRKGISYVSEDRLTLGLILQQSIADNIAVTVLNKILNRLGLISSSGKDSLVNDWLLRVGVRYSSAANAISTLSGGNQQKVVLAKWLSTGPQVMILDCPTVGVDVGARDGIFRIVRDLAEQGMAILLISDEIPEVYYNSDRILHMRNGRIVGEYVPSASSVDAIERAVHG